MARSQLRRAGDVVRRFCEQRSVPYSGCASTRRGSRFARHLEEVGLANAVSRRVLPLLCCDDGVPGVGRTPLGSELPVTLVVVSG